VIHKAIMGGEQSCVETGANPHSMGYILVNRSSKDLTLCSDLCVCQQHRGFNANHGKFKAGWQPGSTVRAGYQDKCWMSGRDGSAVCPEGWIRYDVAGGGRVEIVFNSGGWSTVFSSGYGMNCAAIQVRSPANILVEVVQGSIESDMPTGFHGTDRHRQFTITLRDKKKSALRKLLNGSVEAQRSTGWKIQPEPCTARGPGPDNIAVAGDASAAVPQRTSEIMGCVNLAHNLELVPAFPSVSSPQALKHALDSGYVRTGGIPCAGVAIQRVWWLLHDYINPATQWSQVRAPCIASDVVSWLRIEGFRADHLGSGWSEAIPQASRRGQLVLCVLHLGTGVTDYHWVTLIGVHENDVYVIDYGGIYRIPIRYFRQHLYSNAFAPGAAVVVERGRGIPNVGQGQVVNGFHGNPSRGNSFWVYPRGKALEVSRWDTYDAASFCSHSRRDGQEGDLTKYTCLGHRDLIYKNGNVCGDYINH
jgi:hypothetical protein